MEDYNKKIDQMAEEFADKYSFDDTIKEIMKNAYCIGAREIYTKLLSDGRIKADTELS